MMDEGLPEQFAVSPSVTDLFLPGRMALPRGYPPPGFGRLSVMEDFTHYTKKVKFPTFSESDPHGWLTRAETYFQIHNTPGHHRVPLAHVCMEGIAVHCFTMVCELHS